MATPKWTEERVAELVSIVGDTSPVTQDIVSSAAEALETSARSVSSKLRKMEYEVESATTVKAKAFSDKEAEALVDFVNANSGKMTYSEIAETFAKGKFTAKQVQGKILSLELTNHVKPTPKKEVVKQYTSDEEEKFLAMVAQGSFLEDIAEALGKELPSVRGKALSFLRKGEIEAIPKQKNSTAVVKEDALAALTNIANMTVEEIASQINKTPRGVRTMLTRRGLKASDYDGAAKKEKLAS